MKPRNSAEQKVYDGIMNKLEGKTTAEKMAILKSYQRGMGRPRVRIRTRWFMFKVSVVLVVGVLCLGFALLRFIGDETFASTGTHTRGTIIAVKTVKFGNRGNAIVPVIKYLTSDGTAYQFDGPEHFISTATYTVGDPIDVVYDPNHPSVAVTTNMRNDLTYFVLVPGVVGLFFLGVAVQAIVTSQWKAALL